MMKGISPQLSSISTYLESLLSQEQCELTWESYFLNTEKNTFEIFKLIKIVLSELTDELPRGVKEEFEKSCNLLKQYFKARPKIDIDTDDHEKSYHMEYDEVQHYLDNKPEIVINDDERGELFKFLTMNEQKQKNNQMLLDSMPRYSFDYGNHSSQIHRNKQAPSSQISKGSNFPEINKTANKNSNNFKLVSKMSHTDKRNSVQQVEDEAQTDLTLTVIKDIINCYAQMNLAEKPKQTCDFATEMTDFLVGITSSAGKKTKTKEKARIVNENEGLDKEQTKGESNKQKKSKKRLKDEDRHIDNQDKAIDQRQGNNSLSKKDIRPSAMLSSGKIPTKQEMNNSKTDSKPKPKVRQSKRQSINSLSTSRKDLFKGSTKKLPSRVSKDIKETNKAINESKFSKQKKGVSNSKYQVIIQTTRQLINSHNYQQDKTGEKQQLPLSPIEDRIELEENHSNVQQKLRQSKMSEDVEQLNNNNPSQIVEQSLQAIAQLTNSKKISKSYSKQGTSRQKISSNREEISHSNFLIEQTYASTIGHPFYRIPSKIDERSDNSSLPKIQQKCSLQKNERAQSLKKKIIENSPYAKSIHQDQKSLKFSNASQFNYRSLHLNPLQNQYLFSPKDFNRTLKTETGQFSDYLKNCSSFPRFQKDFKNPFLPKAQQELMLREQHNKIISQIEENITSKRSKDPQWTKMIKSIKHYQLMHASLCGENCIHLSKFYEFLKKKNLSMYINRRELLLHKKNIEINYIH